MTITVFCTQTKLCPHVHYELFCRCESVVRQFLSLDLERADIKAFLTQHVVPTMEGKLATH